MYPQANICALLQLREGLYQILSSVHMGHFLSKVDKLTRLIRQEKCRYILKRISLTLVMNHLFPCHRKQNYFLVGGWKTDTKLRKMMRVTSPKGLNYGWSKEYFVGGGGVAPTQDHSFLFFDLTAHILFFATTTSYCISSTNTFTNSFWELAIQYILRICQYGKLCLAQI